MISDKVITFFRSLTFGGLIGMGVAWILYKRNQSYFEGKVSETHFIAFGSVLGISVHRAIDSALRFVMKPLFDHIDYFLKLAQLTMLKQKGRIGEAEYQNLVNSLTVKFFVGEDVETKTPRKAVSAEPNKQLPPGQSSPPDS